VLPLESLSLVQTRISGTIPDEYGALPLVHLVSKQRLWAPRGGLTRTGVALCRRQDVARTAISGSITQSWTRWKLNYLSFDDTIVSGTLPAASGEAWSAVRKVYMARSRVSGTLPSTLSLWTSLIVFGAWLHRRIPGSQHRAEFMNTEISGTLSPLFSSWTQLTDIQGVRSYISGSLAEEFAEWRSCTRLMFASTGLSGTLSPSLSRWPQLVRTLHRMRSLGG
jgi:hypothetical protein